MGCVTAVRSGMVGGPAVVCRHGRPWLVAEECVVVCFVNHGIRSDARCEFTAGNMLGGCSCGL